MKIEITSLVEQSQFIDAQLPHYYKHVIDLEHRRCVVYGKIEVKSGKFARFFECNSIDESKYHDGEMYYELSSTAHQSAMIPRSLSCYFAPEHASDKAEFEAAKARCLSFLNQF